VNTVVGTCPGAATLNWHGHRLELLPQRAVWDPAQKLLLLADVHLGKAEAFQASGIALPSDGDADNLNRVIELAHRLAPARVIVLGDLTHSRYGLTAELRTMLAALPELLGCPLQLVEGNHDAGSWLAGLPAEPAQAAGPLWLSHEPQRPPAEGLLNLCGHLHPVALLGGGGDRLRLPCFALDRQGRQLRLPAFGTLTGGHPCSTQLQRWVVAEEQVLELP